MQDGRHGKAWGIVHKDGEFFVFIISSMFLPSSALVEDDDREKRLNISIVKAAFVCCEMHTLKLLQLQCD